MAGVFDEHEYAGRRQMLKQNNQILVQELNKIRSSLMSPEEFEDRKRFILALSEKAVNSGLVMNAPFEVKQRLIKTVVDKITLNTNEGWFSLEGVISGLYAFDFGANDGENQDSGTGMSNIESNPKDRDSWRPPSGNLPGRSANPAPG
jgi:hypothetical protein